MTNKEKLRALMREYSITYQQTAGLIGVSVHTVKSWLYPDTCKGSRSMPDNQLELLKIKLH